jgi:phosphoglycerol transferase MdoB-like AlkP superfamily enzyme
MGISDDAPLNKKELVDFPIEKSRMRNIWWIILILVFATALYGFSLGLNTIAIPLILQFFIAYSATAVFSLNSALAIDIYPGALVSATTVNNLMVVRLELLVWLLYNLLSTPLGLDQHSCCST